MEMEGRVDGNEEWTSAGSILTKCQRLLGAGRAGRNIKRATTFRVNTGKVPPSTNMEPFSQVCWRTGEDHGEASKAGCCEAGTGSKEATLARAWTSPSPAAWHNGVMLKEQCSKDGSQDGSYSPGREELPSHTSLIPVTASLHQLLFRHLCIMLPDTCHTTHVT